MKNIYFHLIRAFVNIAVALASNSSLLQSKIIGGISTNLAYKKYMASLRIEGKHVCCGFMISMKITMSTGSCAHYMKSHGGHDYINATVFLGNDDLGRINFGKVVNIDHAMYHEDYDPEDPIGTSHYDIGYILLTMQLPKVRNLGTIRLSPHNIEYEKTYKMYGWGSGKFEDPENELWNVPMSSNLKKIEIKVTNRDVCEKLLGRDLKTNQICGKGIVEGETAAQGDAGGPLVRGYFFFGIISIVNMKGSQSPFVFIGGKPFKKYIDDLKTRFPEDEMCEWTHTNKGKRMNSESSDVSENKKVKNHRVQELKKIFNYERDTDGVKYGKCIECLRSTGSEILLKMKDFNTSGTRYHLRSYHWDLYKKIYKQPSTSKTQISSKKNEVDKC